MQETTGLDMLCFKHLVILASSIRDLDDITLESERQKIDNSQ